MAGALVEILEQFDTVTKREIFLLFGLIYLMNSCCPFIREEHLGNNLYLSEFDNVDRRILFSEETCSGSGIEVVPMTVMEYAFNSEWIIAKSGNKRTDSNIKYWIIKNDYEVEPTVDVIKANVLGPLDWDVFSKRMSENEIHLTLNRID